MYRNHGIPHAFEVSSDFAADRKTGQLVRVNKAGKITTVLGESNLLFVPLVEDVVVQSTCTPKTTEAGATVVGVAKVYVETAAGIEIGESVGVGATGVGVAAFTSGFKLGIALGVPRGDGDYIPVLMAPKSADSLY